MRPQSNEIDDHLGRRQQDKPTQIFDDDVDYLGEGPPGITPFGRYNHKKRGNPWLLNVLNIVLNNEKYNTWGVDFEHKIYSCTTIVRAIFVRTVESAQSREKRHHVLALLRGERIVET